ncbi:DNA alkylation repair protein [Kineothrix sp. MSJ-39]|uniref:DNA alkylation repair protein n=1 Tax=Kineothrix sp. MSJ-39 TaxID=2841533 RepID=UPI001C1119C1|nr:DNA alkylation repair protein [Kineothrix sp. MSJ-39]MBU5430478.1 DNA alkylation repair protein [Kineothrix sp. MSJ-39]
MTSLQKQLFSMQDLAYRDFHSNLMPGIDKNTIIGIRTPQLRKFAKQLAQTEEAEQFLRQLPHQYYEENNLHMMLITQIKEYESCLAEVERFLPYVDNWATCDLPVPKCFEKHKKELITVIRKWISSEKTYIVRYGIGLLMRLYLDGDFDPVYLELVTAVRSEKYYVNMMIAWYLATALAKQWEETIPYLEEHRLPEWVHRKTIQKAIESYRITKEQKEYLRSLR